MSRGPVVVVDSVGPVGRLLEAVGCRELLSAVGPVSTEVVECRWSSQYGGCGVPLVQSVERLWSAVGPVSREVVECRWSSQ